MSKKSPRCGDFLVIKKTPLTGGLFYASAGASSAGAASAGASDAGASSFG